MYPAACTSLTANTRLRCVTSPGVGANLRWRVRVSGGGVSGDEAVSPAGVTTSYAPPAVSWLSAAALALQTPGGQAVHLHGTNFGTSLLAGHWQITVRALARGEAAPLIAVVLWWAGVEFYWQLVVRGLFAWHLQALR